jgi:hypothetical protein
MDRQTHLGLTRIQLSRGDPSYLLLVSDPNDPVTTGVQEMLQQKD